MDVRDRLGLEHPLLQAGMAGGMATADLAASVSNAGALGTIGLMGPARFLAEIRRAQSLAPNRPIAANLLMPFIRRGHVRACIDARVRVAILFFGFDRTVVDALRANGIVVLHQVGTAAEARRAIADGADGLVAQGLEAGGHLLATDALAMFLPRAIDAAAGRPVFAAGGIASADDVRRAIALGASGVLCGTRFLLSDESRAHAEYKRRALGATRTIETTLFGVGWPARHRVLPNAATARWCDAHGGVPAWVSRVQRLAVPLARIAPMDGARTLPRIARVDVPLYAPNAPLVGDDARVVDTAALYAGTSASSIGSVVPAKDIVRDLARGFTSTT